MEVVVALIFTHMSSRVDRRLLLNSPCRPRNQGFGPTTHGILLAFSLKWSWSATAIRKIQSKFLKEVIAKQKCLCLGDLKQPFVPQLLNLTQTYHVIFVSTEMWCASVSGRGQFKHALFLLRVMHWGMPHSRHTLC